MKKFLSFFFSALFLASLHATVDPGTGLKIGDTASDFKLENIDGSFVSLSDYKEAKGFIVIFTCNTCPYAVLYEDRINELDQKFSTKGYQVIAINPNDPSIKSGDSFEAMKVRAKEKGFSFPYLFDAEQNVFPAYGATKTPHVYLLDKEMTVQYIGAIDDNAKNPAEVSTNYVVSAIEAISAGEEVNPTETKAIGCSIKVAQ